MEGIIQSVREQLNEEMSKEVINTELVRLLTKTLDSFQSFDVFNLNDSRLGIGDFGNFNQNNVVPVGRSHDFINDFGHILNNMFNSNQNNSNVNMLIDLYLFFNGVINRNDDIDSELKEQINTNRNIILKTLLDKKEELLKKMI